jgi:hypothetical protein
MSSVDASDAGGTRIDATSSDSSGNLGGIYCGSSSCDPTTQVCCGEVGAIDPGSTIPLRCVPKGTCSGMSPMNIPCDDHADCAKTQPTLPVCCVGTSYGAPTGHFILVECTTQTGCATTANVRHEIVCSGPDDRDSCPTGKACRAGVLRDGYFTCQ